MQQTIIRSTIPETKRIAEDLPGYEEGVRALFANDRTKLEQCIASWPEDIKAHAIRLAFDPLDQST